MIANLHRDLRVGGQDDVASRAELDEPHALAAFDAVANLVGEYDSARQQPGDLLEDYAPAVIPAQGADVLLVVSADSSPMAF